MTSPAYSVRKLTPSLVRAACGHLPSDRRGEMRRAVRFPCRVTSRAGRLVATHMVDLSPQGMLVLSEERLERGADLIVLFEAADLGLSFGTRATLRRLVEGRRPGDDGRALGFHFDSLAAVSRLILRGHLGTAPAVVPQRDPPPELLRRRREVDYADEVRRAMLET
jgi:hypothetical protein